MILLDGIDKHDAQPSPKLVAEASSSSLPVTRPLTPTPSLPPDYESSQAQLRPTTLSYPEIQEKRTRRRRCRRYTIYALAAYFFLTVVIGLPILVVKLKKDKTLVKSNPYQPWQDNSPLPVNSITLGDAPLRISSATACNSWDVMDEPDGTMFMSQLNYRVPVNASVFLNTNISYASNASYLNQFAGSLLVSINDDATETQGHVFVTMHTTSRALTNSTHVCLMETGSGGGMYIFTPESLNLTDALTFNVTLLLPQGGSSVRNIRQLICHLPHFSHTYGELDSQITFDEVILGGAMSGVNVQSLRADSIVVKASTAEIRGTFKVSEQLSLETVSAPINADVHLYNDGTPRKPTYMHLTTGNSVLNANVTLYMTSPSSDGDSSDDDDDDDVVPNGPHFFTRVETFNAPLNVGVAHDDSATSANMQMHASNNLGNTRVTLDSHYAGTFDVNTMFAQADVLTWDGTNFDAHYDDGSDSDSDDESSSSSSSSSAGISSTSDSATPTSAVFTTTLAARAPAATDNVNYVNLAAKKGKVRMYLPAFAVTTTSSASSAVSTAAVDGPGRCLEYDLISSSQIRGWVGVPPRPQPQPGPFGAMMANQSHVEVVSSLSGAQLVLQP